MSAGGPCQLRMLILFFVVLYIHKILPFIIQTPCIEEVSPENVERTFVDDYVATTIE